MKRFIRKIRRLVGLASKGSSSPSSTGYRIVSREEASAGSSDGWLDRSVAEKQDVAFRKLLDGMRSGAPRRDLVVAADAVRATGLAEPSLLEVGCGSGYYCEALPHLLGAPIRYTGLDYSAAMIDLARERYPGTPFVVGDAASLPFDDASFDVVMNGVSLMHIMEYERAIAESARVASKWCIFHTVPVLEHRATTFLMKNAYGLPTVEIIFNERELLDLFNAHRLEVRTILQSLPYNLSPVLGEPTTTKTYVGRIRKGEVDGR